MHEALVDSHIIRLAQLPELVNQKLKQSVAVCLIEHHSHGELIDIGEDNTGSASLDAVFDNIQAMSLEGNSNSLFAWISYADLVSLQKLLLFNRENRRYTSGADSIPACIRCPGSTGQTSSQQHP